MEGCRLRCEALPFPNASQPQASCHLCPSRAAVCNASPGTASQLPFCALVLRG